MKNSLVALVMEFPVGMPKKIVVLKIHVGMKEIVLLICSPTQPAGICVH